MAAPESSRKRSYNTDEAVFAILADDDSDNETFEEETVDEDSSSSENDENQVPAPIAAPVRGAPVRRIRTRGGVRISISQNEMKEQQKRALEDKWKTEDHPPVIPDFTGNLGLKVDLPTEPSPMDFFELFLDEAFYEYLKTQTNLYVQQYLSANHDLTEYSRHRKWVDVTIPEMKKFIALYLLTGIIQKPEIGQYWSTNPIIRTPFFNEIMARNRFQSILEFLHFNDNSGYLPNEPQSLE